MRYDDWKTEAPEFDECEPESGCPICDGDENGEPCSEECQHFVNMAASKASVERIYRFCRHALGLARQYREEERTRGRKSRRLEAVMQQIGVWREDVRFIRMAQKQKKEAA